MKAIPVPQLFEVYMWGKQNKVKKKFMYEKNLKKEGKLCLMLELVLLYAGILLLLLKM